MRALKFQCLLHQQATYIVQVSIPLHKLLLRNNTISNPTLAIIIPVIHRYAF